MLTARPLRTHLKDVALLNELAWTWVASTLELERALVDLSSFPAVAIDTEFVRERTYYPQVALLQLSAGHAHYLIDPLSLDDLSAIRAFFQSDDVLKVVHSGSEDLEVISRWLGVEARAWFDTQVAAALLGFDQAVGFRALVQEIIGIELDKGETRSDWLKRPLSESQCFYAVADVAYLYPVFTHLKNKLKENNRFEWLLEEGRRAAASIGSDRFDVVSRSKNAWRLSPRQVALLSALGEMRETLARERDKPRSWIIDDKILFDLAQNPKAAHVILKAGGKHLLRYEKRVVDCAAEVEGLPESSLPPPPAGPLSSAQRALQKRLKERVNLMASDLNVAPELVFNKRDYQYWVCEFGSGSMPVHWQGWRLPFVTALSQEIESNS